MFYEFNYENETYFQCFHFQKIENKKLKQTFPCSM